MSTPGPDSERAVIVAPSGRDGQIAQSLLREAGFFADISPNLEMLTESIEQGAGLAVIADDALRNADLRPLVDYLSRQPPWSDFPIILLTHRGGGPERNPAAARLAELLGNVIFVERPFHPTTLVSVVHTAVRSRRRQYEARMQLAELEEGERQLQTALEAGHLGSWSLDLETMTLNASDSCKAHFGRRADDAFGYHELLAAVHPEDVELMQASVAHTLRTGADYIIEYRNVWPDGSAHWIDMRARAQSDGNGRVAKLVGVSTDITDRKSAELERERLLGELALEREALSQLSETLEQRVNQRTTELMKEVSVRERVQEQLLQSQKMESIGKLTGGVAHDFNNLLMAVIGNLDLLKKKLPEDARTQRLIDGAIQGAQRGAALTQRMLAFARQQDLNSQPADVGALLAGMGDLLERTLGPQVALRFDIPGDLPFAKIDTNQVELAVLNLAINSRDAMPSGGTIDIKAGTSDAKGERLKPRAYVWISVTDTGHGMDAATLKKAVEPFYSTKSVGKGTGLGLSMVHGLAVQLGGKLDLTSEPGRGTKAVLWLPVSDAAPVADRPVPVAVASTRTATILVVDDDPLIAMSATDMLEDLGHNVIEANSGNQALAILDGEASIDLMITDHAMPGMTGTELAKLARERHPRMPVLLTTGYADLPNGQVTDLPRLSKPYHQAQLQAEINRLLAGVAQSA